MIKNPCVVDILETRLRQGGWDGLYSGECGCQLGDLAPCGEIQPRCRAGYKQIIRSEADREAWEHLGVDLQIGDWLITECSEPPSRN